MAKGGYSNDLRMRAVAMAEAGESARKAVRLLKVGASTAIRWIARWTTTGSVDAKPSTGHSRSPLERHKQWLLDLVAAEPDLTLEEIRTRLTWREWLARRAFVLGLVMLISLFAVLAEGYFWR
jgi:transposase